MELFNEMIRQDVGITWDASNGVIAASVTDEIMSAARDSGCIGLVIGMESGNPEILKKTGLGDEDFFFGPEDTELSFRLKKFGKIIANLDLVTFHKVTSSSNISGWLSRSYYETKGFLLLIKKTGNLWDKLIGYSYFILRIPYFLILLIFKKREKDRVIGFSLGCFDFFFKK